MIKTFADFETEHLFVSDDPLYYQNIARVAIRKLQMLDAACSLNDLRVPPGNRLEKLKGDRQNSYSIRINDQYRICFCWENGAAYDVEIVDYHGSLQMRTTNLIHPGEVLSEEFLIPMGISQNQLAMEIGVPTTRINAIVQGRRSITADTALRLAERFGSTANFWMNLQTSYDLAVAAKNMRKEKNTRKD